MTTVADRIAKARQRASSPANAPHLIVEARAGTGKTFTLVEGLNRLRGMPTKGIIPSPQQSAVWESMERSASIASTTFVAFNKSIASELQRKIPRGCSASTIHSMGFAVCKQAFPGISPEGWRVSNLIGYTLGEDTRQLRKKNPVLLKATETLVGLCKLTLQEPEEDTLQALCDHYSIELNGQREAVFKLTPAILEACKTPDCEIDFNDMIWLPVVLGLPIPRSDLLLVDEAQDLNRCQQELVLQAGKRLILCGDPCQAIYGFAGADTDSIPRMRKLLESTPNGCEVLPLTVTRRCGHRIVEEAKTLVPDFEAHDTNPPGKIESLSPENLLKVVKSGDMVLCRVNAPLVSTAFRLIAQGIRANIQGREIGKGLVSLITKLRASTVEDLLVKLDDYYQREAQRLASRKNPSESALIALQDKTECVRCFCDNATTIKQVVSKIESLFSDNSLGGVLLSSIHRAKGLEAPTVYLLHPELLPHPMAKTAWAVGQEKNLKYVAITRAIKRLVYVG
jgi:superfamily I DNA/RNA helicase